MKDKNNLIMTVGLPASGKSVAAKQIQTQIENTKIYSSDKLREELFGDINEQNKNNMLFQELHKRIILDLKKGHNVVFDATNINYKKRMSFLQQINGIDCIKKCILVATPYEKCLEQNQSRERQVPKFVIDNMYKNIFIPQEYEKWDSIDIQFNYDPDMFTFGVLKRKTNISQDNPNHTLTIFDHCLKTEEIIGKQIANQETINIDIITAAFYHDIGKVFTKQFKNAKGEDTETAHYYNHHFVSAYDTLFYLRRYGLSVNKILAIVNLIQWHMQPFFIKTEKARKKFINLVGEKFYDDLMILHEADKLAK